MLQAIRSLEEAYKKSINYSIGPRRKGDVQEIYSDTYKVQKILKWKSEIAT